MCTKFGHLEPGRYSVQIRWIDDAQGTRICAGPLMKRLIDVS